jgi:hypothetical protein
MPGFNCETWKRICDDVISNNLVICWSYNYSEWWITANDYVDILGKHDSWLIRTARSVQSWCKEHEDAPQHLPWPAHSPDFNTVGPLWSVLESRVWSRLPPPLSLNQPDVLHAELYEIPLETIQNLLESVPRRLQAVLQANGGPTSY